MSNMMVTLTAPTAENLNYYAFDSAGTSDEQLLPPGRNQIAWTGDIGLPYVLFDIPGQVEDPDITNSMQLDSSAVLRIQADSGSTAFKVTADTEGYMMWWISNEQDNNDPVPAPVTDQVSTIPASTTFEQLLDGRPTYVIMRSQTAGFYVLFGQPDDVDDPVPDNSAFLLPDVTYRIRVTSGATAFKADVQPGGLLYWYPA